MSKFPVPVSGEKIPHGWFANLVRFINSLTLRGDGRYTMVSRNESGTTVTLTPAVKNAIEQSGGTPPGSGSGASGLVSTVSGGTASVSVSGSSPLIIKPGNNVQLEDDSGALKINASAIIGMPNYNASSPEFISVSDGSPYIKAGGFSTSVWLIGEVGVDTASNMSGDVQLTIGYTSMFLFDLTIAAGSDLAGLKIPVFIPIPAGITVQITAYNNARANLHAYPTL